MWFLNFLLVLIVFYMLRTNLNAFTHIFTTSKWWLKRHNLLVWSYLLCYVGRNWSTKENMQTPHRPGWAANQTVGSVPVRSHWATVLPSLLEKGNVILTTYSTYVFLRRTRFIWSTSNIYYIVYQMYTSFISVYAIVFLKVNKNSPMGHRVFV